MDIRSAEELTMQFSRLSPERRAYLSGYMDGLACIRDREPVQNDREAGQGPSRKTVAAGPSQIR